MSLYLLQCDGTLLATGSYDGFARIWSTDGKQADFEKAFYCFFLLYCYIVF